MVSTPSATSSAGTSGPFRRMTLRESLRRVGNRLRQSAGRKCKTAVEPTGAPAREVGPTVKRCRLDYERLASVSETPERTGGGDGCAGNNRYEVVRGIGIGCEKSNRYEVVHGNGNCYDRSSRYEVIRGGSSKCDEIDRESNKHKVLQEKNRYEVIRDKSNRYDVISDKSNSYESLRDQIDLNNRHNYEVIREESNTHDDLDHRNNRYEVIRDRSNSYEVLKSGIGYENKSICELRDKCNSYEEIGDFIVHRERKDRGRRSGVTWGENQYVEVEQEREPLRRRRSCLKEIPVESLERCVENGSEETRYGENASDFDLKRNIGGSFRKGKKIRDVLNEIKNIGDVSERQRKSHDKFMDEREVSRNQYEVVRKEKKKKKDKRRKSVSKEEARSNSKWFDNPIHVENKYEVIRESKNTSCYENTLVDDYLNLPENKGTLNPAFEDFTLKSNLAPPKKTGRAPLQEIEIPLDDSLKENRDPNVVAVKRKRKYSVRFEIDEEVEEEISQRRFGNVISEENKPKPSILKIKKQLIEEEEDSTDELLIRNYELLTKDGTAIREESNTTRFVRKKFAENGPEEEEIEEEEEDILPLPVVSLYSAPEDRMPSRKKSCRKKTKKPSENFLGSKTSSSDIRVIGISTTDSLNQPSTLRTDRLAKIVQKFGPEVLMAMGEEGGDSVLAQFKKSLEKPTEAPKEVAVVEEEVETERSENVEPTKRGRKRKHAEDIYGEF